MCVHDATTRAMSSSVTSWREQACSRCCSGCVDCFSISASFFSRSGILPYWSSADFVKITASLGLFQFDLRLFQLCLHDADGIDGGLFVLPLRGERLGFVLEIGEFPCR